MLMKESRVGASCMMLHYLPCLRALQNRATCPCPASMSLCAYLQALLRLTPSHLPIHNS